MKRFLSIIICITLLAAMTGCAKDTPATDNTVTSTPAPTETPAASDTTTEPVDVPTDTVDTPSDDTTGSDDLGAALASLFATKINETTDLNTIAEAIGAASGYDCATGEVTPGFLNGFAEEVSGFSTGVCIAPWIGSIPFVGYVFETDNTDALVSELQSKADPRWNICTEAKDPVIETSGNYVFLVMVPMEEDF